MYKNTLVPPCMTRDCDLGQFYASMLLMYALKYVTCMQYFVFTGMGGGGANIYDW